MDRSSRYDPAVPAREPVASGDEVVTLLPGAAPDDQLPHRQPRLLWAAPGSMVVSLVAAAWSASTSLADLGRISGPWGVVLWNPDRGSYLVVSDPVGVQPLFCARTTSGRVAVASQLAALVDRPDVDDTLDEDGVLLELLRVFSPEVAHRTPFAAVRRVPWGSALEVRPDGTWHPVRYWDPTVLPGPDHTLSLDDCGELLRERIDAAVARALPEDAAGVGAHVSSGLDCTTLACRANQVLTRRGSALVAGYSWAPDDTIVARRHHDERNLIDDVRAQEGFEIRYISDVGAGQWFNELDPCRYPQSTHARERHILPAARADDVTVLLSGWGGDELASFNGRGVMRHLVRTGRWSKVWHHTAARVRIRASEPPRPTTVARAFASEVRSALRPASGPLAATPRSRPANLEAIGARSEFVAEVAARRHAGVAAATNHHDYQLALLANGHLQHRCGWWYQTGRRFGIDYRYPLLDLGVVTAALQLPWWAYRSEGWNRLAYRRAVEGWVPASVAWNILKNEPALLVGLGEEAAGSNPQQRRRRPTGDDAYQQLADLAATPRDPTRSPRDNLDVILSRPDAAPRPSDPRPV